MSNRSRKGLRAIAILAAFSLGQISMQLSFASSPSASPAAALPQGLLARITTKGNAPISINGITSPSGSSITSSALVETPDGVEATIDVSPLGKLELAPNTRIQLDYECPADRLGNPDPSICKLKVTLLKGCVIDHYNQGSHHTIVDDRQQQLEASDRQNEVSGGGVLRVCADAPIARAAPIEGAWGVPETLAVFAMVFTPPTLIIIFAEGENPSPNSP